MLMQRSIKFKHTLKLMSWLWYNQANNYTIKFTTVTVNAGIIDET